MFPLSLPDRVFRFRSIWIVLASLLFSPASALCEDAIALHEAVAQGLISADVSSLGGATGDTLQVTVRKLARQPLRLKLDAGTVFNPNRANMQSMVGARIKGEFTGERRYRAFSEITLKDDNPHRLVVEAYCLDFHKDNPTAGSHFAMTTPDTRMAKLLQRAMEQYRSVGVIQAAVWTDRDKVSAVELKARYPVTDSEIDQALQLLNSSETDVSSKKVTPSSDVAPPIAFPKTLSPDVQTPKVLLEMPQWQTIPVKGWHPDFEVHIEDPGGEYERIVWSPLDRQDLYVFVRNAKAPPDKSGLIEQANKGTLIKVRGDQSLSTQYVKSTLNLKPGLYAVSLVVKRETAQGNVVLIEVK